MYCAIIILSRHTTICTCDSHIEYGQTAETPWPTIPRLSRSCQKNIPERLHAVRVPPFLIGTALRLLLLLLKIRVRGAGG